MNRSLSRILTVRRYAGYIRSRHVLSTSQAVKESPKPFSISLLSRFKGEYYRCPRCNNIMLKSEVKVSGYDSENSQRHVHCTRCGKIIDWAPGDGGLKDVIKGIGLTAAGGALSYLLFPILNAYALQLGFFISMYGTLLALIRPGI